MNLITLCPADIHNEKESIVNGFGNSSSGNATPEHVNGYINDVEMGKKFYNI